MNRAYICIGQFILLAIIGCHCTVEAFQDGGGSATKKPAKKEPVNKKKGGKATAKPSPSGELLIKSSPPGCSVTLDGQVRGVTDSTGSLTVKGIKPGRHALLLRKGKYREEQRAIDVNAGENQTLVIALMPLPGKLNVVANVADATFQINESITYTDRVANQELAPGQYTLKVYKPGYRTMVRKIEIVSEQEFSLTITLEPVPIEELLNLAEQAFRGEQYNQALSFCQEILRQQANHPRANLLVGRSYFNSRNYSNSATYLSKAISMGETVVLPILHHHGIGGYCLGRLVLKKNLLEFQSANKTDHSFSVPAERIYELLAEPAKNGRLHTKVGIQKGSKEDRKDYNFLVPLPGFREEQSIPFGTCDSQTCQGVLDVVYQLIKHLKE